MKSLRIFDSLCCGCGACTSKDDVALCSDAKGFLRPALVNPFQDLGREFSERICPGRRRTAVVKNGIDYDSVWGPIVRLRQGFSCEDEVRRRGASGGTISAILLHLLKSKEIDFVAHVGCPDDAPLVNLLRISHSRAEVLNHAGSRYAPSAPLAQLSLLLDTPGICAFVGKPCDVAALRALIRENVVPEEKVRLLVSFFCAGVPSAKGTMAIIRHFNVKPSDVEEFRYRGNGWPGLTTARTVDGDEFTMTYKDAWGRLLGKDIQFRCKFCPEATGEEADISCGDAWECTSRGYPDFRDGAGNSVIISRTESGERIVSSCIEAHVINGRRLTRESLQQMQPMQVERRRSILLRLLAVKAVGLPVPKFRGYPLVRLALNNSPAKNARAFGGMLRRALRQRNLTETFSRN